MAGESDGIVVVEPRELSCGLCEVTVTVDARMEAFGTVFYTPTESAGGSSSPTIYETNIGRLCGECREAYRTRKRELRRTPKVTVPEPPDEWRHCQECGTQIDPTRLNGQFCQDCSNT